MRVKIFALACVAALATVMPARADILLGYRLSSFVPTTSGTTSPPATQIPAAGALGAPIPGNILDFNPGETKFIQVTIQGTAPAGATQSLWDAGNGMIAFAMGIQYPFLQGFTQPFVQPTGTTININKPNANAQTPYAVGHPNTFMNYNMGQTAITGADLASGIEAATGILAETVIATFKLVAPNTPGATGTVTLFDLNTAPTAAGFGLSDATNLDPIIFAPAHNGFPLTVNVVAIPEPSSMALAGLAIAGFGWRKLRRKTAVVA